MNRNSKSATLPEALKRLDDRSEFYKRRLTNGVVIELDEDDWQATCVVIDESPGKKLRKMTVAPEQAEEAAQKLAVDENWDLVVSSLKAKQKHH